MQDWSVFFETLAGVSITAFALLFAVLQYKSLTWRKSPTRRGAVVAAVSEPFVVLVVSVVSLMPGTSPWRFGAGVGGVVGLAAISYQLKASLTQWGHTDRFDRFQAYASSISVAIYAGLVFAGLSGNTGAGRYWIAALCTWLLLSGSLEVWWLVDSRWVA
jgi:hypothetical protein